MLRYAAPSKLCVSIDGGFAEDMSMRDGSSFDLV
jgi:hypothetical protein